MKTITTTVYDYSELSEKAKAEARNWYLSVSDDSAHAWETVRDDAARIGLQIAALDSRHGNNGEFTDGAFNCANGVMAHHGEGCETYKTAKAFLDAWGALPDTDTEESRSDDADALEGDFLTALLKDYARMLEKEEEHQQSEEYIAEVMQANEYTFLESGKRFG